VSRVWEPQAGESSKAFSCFACYRDLGPQRTLREAAGLFYGKEDGPTQGELDTVKRWSAKFEWSERTRHFDGWLQMERRDAIAEHVRENAEDHAKRESRLREQALDVRERAMEKSLLMLKSPLYRQERIVEVDGEEVTLIMNPANWNLTTAANLFNLAQNRPGLTEDEIEAIGTLDFSNLSEDELIRLMDLEAKIVVLPPDHGGGR